MPDEPSRLLGLAGLRVTRVLVTESDALDLEVEGVGPAGRCRHCGCEDLVVKERPVVGVRDLPLAGRVARILWRKRRWRCRGCGRSHTEQHPALPSRQRVSGRFREQLVARAAGGGAHAEIAREEATSRYQVARAPALVALTPVGAVRRLSLDEAHHRRGRQLATVVSDLDRRPGWLRARRTSPPAPSSSAWRDRVGRVGLPAKGVDSWPHHRTSSSSTEPGQTALVGAT